MRAMFAHRTGAQTFEAWIQAFCKRKYNSDFSKEMSRSVRVYLQDYDDKTTEG